MTTKPEDRAKEIQQAVEAGDTAGKRLDALCDAVEKLGKRLDEMATRRKDSEQEDTAALLKKLIEKLDAKPEAKADQSEDKNPGDPMPRAGEPGPMAADARADAARADALADEFQAWDRVAGMFGRRADRPMDGETLRTYRIRNIGRYKEHSPRWKDQPARELPDNTLALMAHEVRADAEIGARSNEAYPTQLREVREPDFTGRIISRFYGPVSATLEPFRLPAFKLKNGFNTKSDWR